MPAKLVYSALQAVMVIAEKTACFTVQNSLTTTQSVACIAMFWPSYANSEGDN